MPGRSIQFVTYNRAIGLLDFYPSRAYPFSVLDLRPPSGGRNTLVKIRGG